MQARMRAVSSSIGPGRSGQLLHPGRELGPREQAVLDDLGEAARELARGQRGQELGVHHDQVGLPDRADVVLALGQVNAGLAADRRVNHRQQGGGDVHQPDAALVGGGDEAGQVAHHAAPEGDDRVGAAQAGRGGPAAQALDLGQGLGALAGRDRGLDHPHARGLERGRQARRRPGQVGVAHQQGRRPGIAGGQQLSGLAQEARADVDRKARGADLGPPRGGQRGCAHRAVSVGARRAQAATRAATSSTGPSASTSSAAASR